MKNYIAPGSDNMISDMLKDPRFKNWIDINSFIKVPDGEMPVGCYDADGKRTDDPKKMATKPYMMWYDKDDLPTSNADYRIPKKDKIAMESLTKDAKTNEDFEIIYQRELELWNAPDGKAFKKYLTDKVKAMLLFEEALPQKDRVYTSIAQDLCTNFLEWLENTDSEGIQNKGQKTFEFPPIQDGILKPVGMTKLLEIEKSLIEDGYYIDTTGRWYRNMQDLADLLWAFKAKNYFKSKTDNKFTSEEKKFFKKRYKCEKQVEQYLYPSKKVNFDKNRFNHYFT
ncbi:MAG: hypothetical protein ABI237_11630 [Ginsengibacter sp.]